MENGNWLEGPGFIYKFQEQWSKDISSKDAYVCTNNYFYEEFNENHGKNSAKTVRNNVHGRFSNLINDVKLEKNENGCKYVGQLIDEKIKSEEEMKSNEN